MSAKRETATHCLNELEIRAELLEIKGKKAEAKQGRALNILFLDSNLLFSVRDKRAQLQAQYKL